MRAMIKVLRLLRKEANLSQKELSDRMTVSRDLIARLENKIQKITHDILEKYAAYFRIEVSQLYQLAEAYQNEFEYIFRAQSAEEFTPELRDRFEEWYDRMLLYTMQVPNLPILQIPDNPIIKNTTNPAEIANLLRRVWNLGSTPIHDPVALAESLGFFITGTELPSDKLFAISGRRGKHRQPGIMINTKESIPIERQRFSIIHELGHLILHEEYFSTNPDYSGYGRSKEDFEKESDIFAGSLLIPEEEFLRLYRLLRSNVNDLPILILILKRHFKVSYQAIIYRLFDLHLIDENARNRLFAIFKSRFLNNEPLPLGEPLQFTQETKIKELLEKKILSAKDAETEGETETEITTANPLYQYQVLFSDYQVNLNQLWEVLQGKRVQSGEWDFKRIFKRLLEGLTWYELIKIISVETIKEHLTDDLIASLYPPGLREYYANVKQLLHDQTLPADGWLSASRSKARPAILSDRWYSPESTLPAA